MTSLLNPSRPPVFCPGCSHERSLHVLDRAFQDLELGAEDVVIVSDIGCSGLFDVFFRTHAFHGLHGRALTYAAGIKMARPHLKVVVTMGDGGLGIGGAHLLAACRRNMDLTLLVLNNFNFGMTGGQFSCTTPPTARVGSAFLNELEHPMDVCRVAAAAGAPFVVRRSVFSTDLKEKLREALLYPGFALVDVWGGCPGRYMKKNPLSPKDLERQVAEAGLWDGPVEENVREEFRTSYAARLGHGEPPLDWQGIEPFYEASLVEPCGVVLLGAAGERVISAGALLAETALRGGLHATQKNEYNITVMRGPSITEVLLSPRPIDFTGIEHPGVIAALAPEGVARRKDLFEAATEGTLLLRAADVAVPESRARRRDVDFKGAGIGRKDRALASLVLIGQATGIFSVEQLGQTLRQTVPEKLHPAMEEVFRKAAALEAT
ncbi:Pyruvate ferredoxin/flavodoxin oxidoreductase [Desulfacinum hydrothermale DSM 13146]|uniref:Pyruvate ferredoxin/flavodoxin oxidoreductase n=1 Tax=Desulfacinum hydrothermale DSM 13146 TaxID=1121390 RepID=A0A1W1XDV1_9BACT|nr:thiamine pyrophosphate-dependent enzyme [Desulfacinum hydrothermale]SMC21964.1 Pyruvate ferredoxin/flavodoxin oxidoreductase [Desulfacinum hydrothermale DSM 13146]